MYRDLAAERAAKRGPDAHGDRGSAAARLPASPLGPYRRERAGGESAWGPGPTTSSTAGAATAVGPSRHQPPSDFVVSFPPPALSESDVARDLVRPPLRDGESWPWTPSRDQHYPTHREYGEDDRRYYASDRWESTAAGLQSTSSAANWTARSGLNRSFRGPMDAPDDVYPVRGESNQEWGALSHRFDGRPTSLWGYTRGVVGGSDVARGGSVNQHEEMYSAEPKREVTVAQRKRPYQQDTSLRQQQDALTYDSRPRVVRGPKSAVARLSHWDSASPSRMPPDRMSEGSADSPAPPSDSGEGKTSRYLREIDRRNILARIESGEKQSELAKEFHVTRAAICNLKKHRDVILSRVHANPFAKHPKKTKLKLASNQKPIEQQRAVAASVAAARKAAASGHAALRKNPLLLQVASRPALLHFQRLSDPTSTVRDFRRICRRLMTLVVEEALAWVETAAFKRKASKSAASGSAAQGGEVSIDSRESRDACAVMVEPATSLFRAIFRTIDPDAPVGSIHFGDFGFLSTANSMDVVDVDLPPELAASHVYVFHTVVTLDRSAWIAQAVRALIEHGAGEAFVCLVTVCVAAEAVAELQAAFPLLKIATAQIDHPRREGGGLIQEERVVDQLTVRVARDADTEDES